MICPSCQHPESKVVDSRDTGDAIRRRRECERCGRRFTTHERLELRLPQVQKKSGAKECFDRNKVLGGLLVACRKRPVAAEALEAALARIEQQVFAESERGEITSRRVGELVQAELLGLDRVAYLRFASVYQELARPEQFLALVQPLLGDVR